MEFVKNEKGEISKVMFDISELKDKNVRQNLMQEFDQPDWHLTETQIRINKYGQDLKNFVDWDDISIFLNKIQNNN